MYGCEKVKKIYLFCDFFPIKDSAFKAVKMDAMF